MDVIVCLQLITSYRGYKGNITLYTGLFLSFFRPLLPPCPVERSTRAESTLSLLSWCSSSNDLLQWSCYRVCSFFCRVRLITISGFLLTCKSSSPANMITELATAATENGLEPAETSSRTGLSDWQPSTSSGCVTYWKADRSSRFHIQKINFKLWRQIWFRLEFSCKNTT